MRRRYVREAGVSICESFELVELYTTIDQAISEQVQALHCRERYVYLGFV